MLLAEAVLWPSSPAQVQCPCAQGVPGQTFHCAWGHDEREKQWEMVVSGVAVPYEPLVLVALAPFCRVCVG